MFCKRRRIRTWETRVTSLLGIDYPIIQGGLAYLFYSDVAAAVLNAGGLGQITAMSLDSPEALRHEIQKVLEKTNRPFGVNVAIGQQGRPFEDILQVAIKEKVTVVSMTGGNPAPMINRLEIETKTPAYEALKGYISGQANKAYIYEGKDNQGFTWAGK